MKRILVVSIFAFSLLSCGTIKYFNIAKENVSYPELDTTITRNVGDILLQQGTREVADGLEFTNDSVERTVKKGLYRAVGKQQDYIIYKPVPSSGAEVVGSGMIPNKGLAMKNGSLFIFSYGGFGNVVTWEKIPISDYKRTKVPIEGPNNLQQTLIYTGKEKNILKFSYREFSESMARPAYTVDVTYDLEESREIAFKQARIKILEATNTSLTYIVIKNFN